MSDVDALARAMAAHRAADHPAGKRDVWADCCDLVAVETSQRLLAGDAARLAQLVADLTVPLPNVSCGSQDAGQRTLAP